MGWEPVIRFPTAWTSVLGNFGVHLFEGYVSLEEMDRMQALAERWLMQRQDKLVELVVIHPSDARMSHEERSRMARLIKLGESRRNASATVILAEGLMASVQRSILTGLTMLVPPPHPTKVFGQIEPAVTWLHPYLEATVASGGGATPKLTELRSAIAQHLTEFAKRPDRPTIFRAD
ncbi:MAG: hypothetical protein QM778_15580 [Myxococcales bacterium]